MENLFFAISERNRRLVQKLGHISRRSTREKLLSYLSLPCRMSSNMLLDVLNVLYSREKFFALYEEFLHIL